MSENRYSGICLDVWEQSVMPGAVGLTSVIFANAYTISKFYLNGSPPVAALTTVHWHTSKQ